MKRHWDEMLEDLRANLLKMGALAQESIFKSVKALVDRDNIIAENVIKEDSKIDELELHIDELCIDFIACHQPMASDLRFITIAMKINAELERIADLAVDISERVLEVYDKPLLKQINEIPKLSAVAQNMVGESIESFVKQDVDLAKKVVRSDSDADELRDMIYKELMEDFLKKDTKTADRAVPLLILSRHLERICDHATNIAEDVIYMVEGKVVKHHPEEL